MINTIISNKSTSSKIKPIYRKNIHLAAYFDADSIISNVTIGKALLLQDFEKNNKKYVIKKLNGFSKLKESKPNISGQTLETPKK